MMDQILAILFFIVLVNSLKRLTMGYKARLTSWGMFLIMAAGFFFNLVPNAASYEGLKTFLPWIRLTAYVTAIFLGAADWIVYDKSRAQSEIRGEIKK